MVLTSFVEESNYGYVVRLVLFGVTHDIQLIVLSNFILSLLLLDDGSVFRRAVLALHRSGSPVFRGRFRC